METLVSVAKLLGGAIAGNAAYDALKCAVAKIRPKKAGLHTTEVTALGLYATMEHCKERGIAMPDPLTLKCVVVDYGNLGRMKPGWKVRMSTDGFLAEAYVRFGKPDVTRVRVSTYPAN